MYLVLGISRESFALIRLMIDVVLFVILYDFSYFAGAAVIHLNSDLDSE